MNSYYRFLDAQKRTLSRQAKHNISFWAGERLLSNQANADQNEYILQVENLSKSFAGTLALRNVCLNVKRGEVHALMGENGAGKSTLMKTIIGLHKQDAGTITFEGKPYHASNPAEAIRSGISMIHQELNPEPYMTVAENIFLHREHLRFGFLLDEKKTNLEAGKLLRDYDFHVSPRQLLEELNLSQIQMIEIIKAVSCNAKLVIMDEPTSSLDSHETDRLFKTIRQLKSAGVSIIYISHRMEEIFEISDRISVFRDGEYIGTENTQDVTPSRLISMMVGREVSNVFPKVDCDVGEVVFKADKLCGKGFADISFSVRSGEILGFTGLAGAGRSETMRAIFGLDPLDSGDIYLENKKLNIRSPRHAIDAGIAMVNEDRRGYGLCLYRSLNENISLPNLRKHQKGPLLNERRERNENKTYSQRLRIKAASLEAEAASLSGGNQQKVVLAKWLMANPKVLILDEPTRGVDVGAKAEIHTLVCEFAAQGMAILLISSELPEVMGMCDRILIYHEGRVNGEVMRADILRGEVTQKHILAQEFGEVSTIKEGD